MVIKRIRSSARRKHRPLEHVRDEIEALTAYVLHVQSERLLQLEAPTRATNYILDAKGAAALGIETGEKVEFHGTRNLVSTNLQHHQQQMAAACLLAPNAKDPMEHYIVSWRAGECPNKAQIEEVVDIFAEVMGYQDCQIVWAVHSNTSQLHLHIVVNRIDLITRRVVSPAGGWEIEGLHQVIALVEDEQGWSSEENALYYARHGVVFDRVTDQVVRHSDGSRTGHYRRQEPLEIGERDGNQAIAAALRSATSWRDLHYRLAKVHTSYSTKGSGAQLFVRDQRIKASDFGREYSFKNMVARLGPYEPDVTKEIDPHDVYRAALHDERVRLRDAMNDAIATLRRRRAAALKHAKLRQQDQYLQVITEARFELAFDRAEAAIRREFDLVRRTIAASYLNHERWLLAGKPAAMAVKLPEIIFAGVDSGDRDVAYDRGFQVEPHAGFIEYMYESGKSAVTDYGILLVVHKIDVAAIELALSLATKRAETVTISGSPAFVETCRAIARAHAFYVVDDDGRPLNVNIDATRLARETTHSPPSTKQLPGRNLEPPQLSPMPGPTAQYQKQSVEKADSEQELLRVQREYRDRAGKAR